MTSIARPWIEEKYLPRLPPQITLSSNMTSLNPNGRPNFAFLSQPPTNWGNPSESGYTNGASTSYKTWSATSTVPDQGPWHLQTQLERMESRPVSGYASSVSERSGFGNSSSFTRDPTEILAPLKSILHIPSAYRADARSSHIPSEIRPPIQSVLPLTSKSYSVKSSYDNLPSSPLNCLPPVIYSKSLNKTTNDSSFSHNYTRENVMIQIDEPDTPSLASQFLTSSTWNSLARKPPPPPPSVKTTKTSSTSWSKKYAGGLDQPVKQRIQDAQSSFSVSTGRNKNSKAGQGRKSYYCCGSRKDRKGWMLLGRFHAISAKLLTNSCYHRCTCTIVALRFAPHSSPKFIQSSDLRM